MDEISSYCNDNLNCSGVIHRVPCAKGKQKYFWYVELDKEWEEVDFVAMVENMYKYDKSVQQHVFKFMRIFSQGNISFPVEEKTTASSNSKKQKKNGKSAGKQTSASFSPLWKAQDAKFVRPPAGGDVGLHISIGEQPASALGQAVKFKVDRVMHYANQNMGPASDFDSAVHVVEYFALRVTWLTEGIAQCSSPHITVATLSFLR